MTTTLAVHLNHGTQNYLIIQEAPLLHECEKISTIFQSHCVRKLGTLIVGRNTVEPETSKRHSYPQHKVHWEGSSVNSYPHSKPIAKRNRNLQSNTVLLATISITCFRV
ncbi:hypothetical protein VNO78_15432 [Psophocarpus tetragonolobus]|uniref:Uncharacterized protein n=1 Tax=Psophocarpus tetragonolobus TaxID=3891 RepID=A0AAN9SEK7_PSOTE